MLIESVNEENTSKGFWTLQEAHHMLALCVEAGHAANNKQFLQGCTVSSIVMQLVLRDPVARIS